MNSRPRLVEPVAERSRRWRAMAGAALCMLLTATLAVTVPSGAGAGGPVPGPAGGEEPAESANDVPQCPPTFAGQAEPRAAEEHTAVDLAVACQTQVEVSSAREVNQRTFAQPDGTLRTEIFAVPQWALNDDGDWVDVDTTLRRRADGSVRSVATVSAVQVSAGGDEPFVTVTDPDGGALSLRWPGELPEPTLAGDTATYAGVFPGVDLTVTADIDGFSYALVVHSAQAAADAALARVEVGIEGEGLQVAQQPDGSVVAAGASGAPVFASGPALMWDSSQPALSDLDGAPGLSADDLAPGRIAEMPIELTDGALAVLPDQDMLADPATEYPVTIDPPFVGSRLHWANVHREQPSRGWTGDSNWPRAGGMRVGMCTWAGCDDATGLWRSVVRFDTGALSGRHIVTAAVRMTQTHTGGCGGTYPLRLWQVSAFTSGVSWNGVTWRNGSALQTRNVSGSNSGCGEPNRAVTFNNSDVRSRVQVHANQGHQTMSFGLRSGTESNRDQWRRISRDSLRLEVEHASIPRTPTNLSSDGRGCASSGPGHWLSTGRPTLSGNPRNADNRGHYRIEVRQVGSSSNTYSFRSGEVSVNRTVSHRLPASAALSDGEYRWRMRTESPQSGVPNSSYSSWCYFGVDTTPPPPPWAVLQTSDPQQGEPVEVQLRGDRNEVTGFRYSLSGGAVQEVSAQGQGCEFGGSCYQFANVTLQPPAATIDHVLQVWARDSAGNLSERYDLWFTTGKDLRALAPTGVWRFDGDLREDSGNGHHLTAESGVAFTDDRDGRAEAAIVSPAANGCLQAGAPVLDTTDSFTVAAWVKVAEGGSNLPAVITQAGHDRAAFYLEYRHAVQRWNFKMTATDEPDPAWRHARASQDSAPGQWQHVAGVYDAAAAQMRLYVDGVLDAVVDAHSSTWQADGPLVVGCVQRLDGGTYNTSQLEVDDVVAYQGVLTGARLADLMAQGPPAGEVSWWPLRGNGADAGSGGNHLTVTGAESWVPDSFGRAGSALRLDGASCASTDSPVVRSDDSFTVSAWVRPEQAADPAMTVMALDGGEDSAVLLRRNTHNEWVFALSAEDGTDAAWHRAQSLEEATGGWQHLTGVYDAGNGQVRLYVDGALQDEAPVPDMWRATGDLHIGCVNPQADRHRLTGAVHDVRVWRGAASPAQVQASATTPVSFWSLDGHGLDTWGSSNLGLHGDYEWVDDRSGWPESAFGLSLDGDGWAETGGPVVTTDESFTVSAWAKLDSKDAYRTVLAQRADERSSFYINYNSNLDRWQFGMPSEDANPPERWHYARSSQAPQVGVWYHLTGVFDLAAGELRLYVNGELQESVPAPAQPWHVDGALLLGTAGDTSGNRWSPMVGAIDMVRVYSGVLDELRIADQGVAPFALLLGPWQVR